MLGVVDNHETVDIYPMVRCNSESIACSLVSRETSRSNLCLNSTVVHLNRDDAIEAFDIIILLIGRVLLLDPSEKLPVNNKRWQGNLPQSKLECRIRPFENRLSHKVSQF